MDLHAAESLAQTLMEAHLGASTTWTFKWDRAQDRFGFCQYRPQTISLSKHLTAVNSEEVVGDVILHEIAHVLAGPSAGHGPKWKKIARDLGGSGRRCAGPETVQVPKRYVAVCPMGCGFTYQRSRMTARTIGFEICRACAPASGASFEEYRPYELVWTDTKINMRMNPDPNRVKVHYRVGS